MAGSMPFTREALGLILSMDKLSRVATALLNNPGIQEVEEGESGVQGCPWPLNEFQASLHSIRLCLACLTTALSSQVHWH